MSDHDINIHVIADIDDDGFVQFDNHAHRMTTELQRLDDAAHEMTVAMAKTEQAMQESGNAVDDAGDEYRQLTEGMQRLDDTAHESTANMERMTAALKRGEEIASQVDDEFHKTTQELAALNKEAQNSAGLEAMRKRLDDAISAYRVAASVSINLKSEYKELKKSGEGTTYMFEQLSQHIEKAQEKELAAINATRDLIGQMNRLETETGQAATDFTELNQQLDSSESYITRLTPNAKRLGSAIDDLSKETGKSAQKLDTLNDEARETNSRLSEVANETRNTTAAIVNLDEKMNRLTNWAIAGVTAALTNFALETLRTVARQIGEFVKGSLDEFSTWDNQIRQIMISMPGASRHMTDQMISDANKLAAELGRQSDEVLPALNRAIKLGATDPLNELTIANQAARGGFVELADTLILGRNILNAYGLEAEKLTGVYDTLFFITQNSNLTWENLNQGMNAVNSAASEVRLPLDQVAAALVVMNKQGDDAAEAFDLLSNMLTRIGIEGTPIANAFFEAAGTNFRQFIADGGSLAEAMDILVQHAKETGQAMSAMLGGGSSFYVDQQAARAALELTGIHLEELKQQTTDVATATGLMSEAHRIATEGLGFAEEQTNATTEALQIQIGEALEPATRAWLNLKLEAAESIGAFFAAQEATARLKKDIAALGDFKPAFRDHLLQAIAADTYEESLNRLHLAMRVLETDQVRYNDLQHDFTTELRHAIDALAAADMRAAAMNDTYRNLAEAQAHAAEQAEAMTLSNRELAGANYEVESQAEDTTEAVTDQTAALAALERQAKRTAQLEQQLWAMFTRQRDPIHEVIQATADLEAAQEELAKAPWNKEAAAQAEEASGRIVAGIAGIRQEYRGMILDMIQDKFGDTFNESVANALVAMGKVTQEEADLMLQTYNTGKQIELLGTTLLATFLEDGYLSREEAALLEGAIKGIEDGTITATDVLDSMADDTLPALISALETGRSRAGVMRDKLLELAGNYEVVVKFKSDDSEWNPPYIPGPGDPGYNPGDNHGPPQFSAEGAWLTGGIPGMDSVHLLGMPGERMLSLREIENMGGPAAVDRMAAGLLPGAGLVYQDNSHHVTYNNSREAVALAHAIAQRERRARLDEWMGIS